MRCRPRWPGRPGFDTVFVSGFCGQRHAAGRARHRLAHPDRDGRGRATHRSAPRRTSTWWSTPTPATATRSNTDPYRRPVGAGRRGGHLHRGPGVAEALRAHGRQAGDRPLPTGWRSCAPRVTTDTSLHVTARTDARAAIGLDEAIERARMARDCGVDAVFVEAPESIDEMVAHRRSHPRRHPGRQHGRARSHAAAHACRAGRPRLPADRVAVVGAVPGGAGHARVAGDPARRGFDARSPRFDWSPSTSSRRWSASTGTAPPSSGTATCDPR